MLSPETLAHLAAFTCPGCEKPLGVWHCYPVTDPATLLSQLTEHAPHCLQCAQDVSEDLVTHQEPGTQNQEQSGLSVIYKVKSAPTAPSGRLVRLDDHDPSTVFIRLFSPAEILFYRVAAHDRATIVSPASREEAYEWLKPAIDAASQPAPQGSDEEQEIVRQIARLMRFLPPTQKRRADNHEPGTNN